MIKQIVLQEITITLYLKPVFRVVHHAPNAHRRQLSALGARQIIYMSNKQTLVLQRLIHALLVKKILIFLFAGNAVSSAKHAQIIRLAQFVFQITV